MPVSVVSQYSITSLSSTSVSLGGTNSNAPSPTSVSVTYMEDAYGQFPIPGNPNVTTVTVSSFPSSTYPTYPAVGDFAIPITGLMPATSYWFRPFVTNGSGTGYYPIAVEFTTLDDTAELTALALSGVTLSPSFGSTTYSYTSSVANSVTSTTITPTTGGIGGTVTVNGLSVLSGSPIGPFDLAVGTNTFTIIATSQDGLNTQSYSVVVTRAANSNSDLDGLSIGTDAISPSFATGTTSYTANTNYSSIRVTPTVHVPDTSTVTVNSVTVASGAQSNPISLSFGTNTITVVVTAEDASTTTYTITVTRAVSTNANLSNLSLSGGMVLSPAFSSSTTSYTASVASIQKTVVVTPVTANDMATIVVNGVALSSGSGTEPINLPHGSTTITVTVTAQDGTTIKTYTVNISRNAFIVQVNPASSSRATGKNQQQLMYGTDKLTLEEAGDITTDRYGISSGNCVFKCVKEDAAELAELFLLLGRAQHPYANWLILSNRRIVFSPGHASIVCTFEGCKGPSDFIFEFEGGAKEEPIETHPNFYPLARQYGIWQIPDGEGNFHIIGNDGGYPPDWNGIYVGAFQGFRSSSLLAGVEAFLDFGQGTWKATQSTNIRPINALAALGHINTPIGDAPIFDDGRPSFYVAKTKDLSAVSLFERDSSSRNYLYMGMNYTQRGSAFLVTHQWLMSGPGGWNPLIYTPVEYNIADLGT